MEVDAEFPENVAQGEKVNYEEEGSQDRALGHTTFNWGCLGLRIS